MEHGFAISGDDRERVRRVARLEHRPSKPERGERRLLRRLEHDRRSSGDRRCQLVRNLVQGVVERRDRSDERDRLTCRERPPRTAVRRDVAGEELAVVMERGTRPEREHVDGTRDLVARVGEAQAGLAGDQHRELVGRCGDRVGDPPQDPAALVAVERDLRAARAVERAPDPVACQEGNRADHLAGVGVAHFEPRLSGLLGPADHA